MNRQASVLFKFISSSSISNHLALQGQATQHLYYQRLIHSLLSRSICAKEDFQQIGRQLANIAHHAYFAKRIETVDQASQIMLDLPISSELTGIAHYYQAICAKRKCDFDGAHRLLERALEEAPKQYKAQALLTIGATYFDSGEVEASLPFFLIAGRVSRECNQLTLIESQRGIAVVRSIHGDHKQALDDLERLFPLVRAVGKHYPALYYDYLNSLAVELGEVGRIDEAKAACAITLASPFSAAYPNWSETRDELEAKRIRATPSIVAVSAAPEPASSSQPARNLNPAPSLAIIYPARNKTFIQISIAIVIVTIAPIGISQSTLDRLRDCVNPRSPPARF